MPLQFLGDFLCADIGLEQGQENMTKEWGYSQVDFKKVILPRDSFPECAVLRALLKKSLTTPSTIFLGHQPSITTKLFKYA